MISGLGHPRENLKIYRTKDGSSRKKLTMYVIKIIVLYLEDQIKGISGQME